MDNPRIAPIPIKDLLNIISGWEKIDPNMKIPLESILMCCYPTAYDEMKDWAAYQYMEGFRDGQKAKEEELDEAKGFSS